MFGDMNFRIQMANQVVRQSLDKYDESLEHIVK